MKKNTITIRKIHKTNKIKLNKENEIVLSNLGNGCDLSLNEMVNGIVKLYIIEHQNEDIISQKIKKLHPFFNIIDNRISAKYIIFTQIMNMCIFIIFSILIWTLL